MIDDVLKSEEYNDTCKHLLKMVLGCGYMDIPTLIYVVDMDDELFNGDCLYDALDEMNPCRMIQGRDKPGVSFNDLIGSLMYAIVYNLASELDNMTDEPKYGDIISEHWDGGFTNYMDSHFGIECLDDYQLGSSKDELLVKFKAELDMWEEKNKGLDKSWNND